MNLTLQTYTASLQPEILLQMQTNFIIMDKFILAESKEAYQAAITLELFSKLIQEDLLEEQNINYQVSPLEGVWHLLDNKIGFSEPNNIEGKMMIRQPFELTEIKFGSLKAKALLLNEFKDLKESLLNIKFLIEPAQKVIQILHIGPYTNEKASFDEINSFANKNDYHLKYEYHREIYLKDMRHTSKDKFETILRVTI